MSENNARNNVGVLILVACIVVCIVAIFFTAPKVLGPVLFIFVIGGLVGLFRVSTLNKRAPPPWRKRDADRE